MKIASIINKSCEVITYICNLLLKIITVELVLLGLGTIYAKDTIITYINSSDKDVYNTIVCTALILIFGIDIIKSALRTAPDFKEIIKICLSFIIPLFVLLPLPVNFIFNFNFIISICIIFFTSWLIEIITRKIILSKNPDIGSACWTPTGTALKVDGNSKAEKLKKELIIGKTRDENRKETNY